MSETIMPQDAHDASVANRSGAEDNLTPAQGQLLAQLVSSLYPEWTTDDVFSALGTAAELNHGPAGVTALAMLIAAADQSNGTPGVVRFSGLHWDTAWELAGSTSAPLTSDLAIA